MWTSQHTDSILLEEMTKSQWKTAKKKFEAIKTIPAPSNHLENPVFMVICLAALTQIVQDGTAVRK